MIVDIELANNNGIYDIKFDFVNSLRNNIFFSIEESGIKEIKKNNDSNLLLIKNLVENSLKWIVDNNRCDSIDVLVEKQNINRVNILIYCKLNDQSITYEYFYDY